MLVANIKIWKSHLNIREGSDYPNPKMAFIFPISCSGLFFVLLLYVPSQQLWSLRDGQFT